MITFTNPRLRSTIDNWPSGSKRVTCVFEFQNGGEKGWRVLRTTTGKPKVKTYGGKGAIVDGSDGRTYLIQFAGSFDFIRVSASDFMDADRNVLGFDSAVYPDSNKEHYAILRGMIEQAHAVQRLEYLRGELQAERISYGELSELQNLAKHIDPSDVELLEAAGVPEKRS